MMVSDLVRRPGSWLAESESTGVVISCRARLARNLHGERFPDWAEPADRVRVLDVIERALVDGNCIKAACCLRMGELNEMDLQVLQERHLISCEMAERGAGGGVVVSGDESIAVMINEEDHLRLQAIRPGMDLAGVWQELARLDSALESRLRFAFDSRLGYLTACPSNVGTGLRVSVMLHLLGLRLTNELEQVIKALDRLGLAVRGLWGEGSEATGHMFQVSNQETLGQTEEGVIEALDSIVREVARQEQNARRRMMETSPHVVMDCIARALAILQHARVLYSDEALDYLSALRLGLELGLVEHLTVNGINEIMLLMQPGHLQKVMARSLEPDQRDRLRADMVRKKLTDVTLRD